MGCVLPNQRPSFCLFVPLHPAAFGATPRLVRGDTTSSRGMIMWCSRGIHQLAAG
ncbi:hypothetical protein PR003_g2739 [Phytophthora rubi]|uniref:Uncharacterized protein n=1 Tax=Phytophthora rubi TaxID=129364 RepID=A0A6A3P558_9STRA|nr:hypothetical protein PR001_g2208 [Phytophthora rubi]KAE9355616.1 hypothetical protein PR003_g2739 [Phytophthora rubi]